MKLYDIKQVAKFLDLTVRRVRMLVEEGVIRETLPGKFDLLDTNRRYINFIRKGSGDDGKEIVNYNTERALLVRAKRLNEELELQEREKTLHETAEIERVLSQALGNFRSRLLNIPSTLSPLLATKSDKSEINHILKEEINEALTEISDFNTILQEKEESDHGTDTETHGRPIS